MCQPLPPLHGLQGLQLGTPWWGSLCSGLCPLPTGHFCPCMWQRPSGLQGGCLKEVTPPCWGHPRRWPVPSLQDVGGGRPSAGI